MRKTAFIITGLLFVGFVVVCYLMYTNETTDQVRKTPEYIMSAKELLTEFEKNDVNASSKYIDKRIQLTGVLKSIDTSGSLILGAAGDPGEIIIAVHPRYKESLTKVSAGSTVIVQGICSSFSQDKPAEDDLLSGLGATIRFRSGGIKP